MSVAIVQLPATSAYYSQVKMHTSTTNPDISLARGFQKHISNPTWAHGLLYHGKDRKYASKQKWTDRDYHFKYRKYVPHTSVKTSWATNQFPEFLFFGLYKKPHGVRW